MMWRTISTGRWSITSQWRWHEAASMRRMKILITNSSSRWQFYARFQMFTLEGCNFTFWGFLFLNFGILRASIMDHILMGMVLLLLILLLFCTNSAATTISNYNDHWTTPDATFLGVAFIPQSATQSKISSSSLQICLVLDEYVNDHFVKEPLKCQLFFFFI